MARHGSCPVASTLGCMAIDAKRWASVTGLTAPSGSRGGGHEFRPAN
jgi:hypothetical protein